MSLSFARKVGLGLELGLGLGLGPGLALALALGRALGLALGLGPGPGPGLGPSPGVLGQGARVLWVRFICKGDGCDDVSLEGAIDFVYGSSSVSITAGEGVYLPKQLRVKW